MVLDLLRARRLANVFPRDKDHAIARFHELFCDVYELFNRWWEHAQPENIMAFQSVFGEFSTKVSRHIEARGTVPPPAWVPTACTQHRK